MHDKSYSEGLFLHLTKEEFNIDGVRNYTEEV